MTAFSLYDPSSWEMFDNDQPGLNFRFWWPKGADPDGPCIMWRDTYAGYWVVTFKDAKAPGATVAGPFASLNRAREAFVKLYPVKDA